MKNIPQLSKLVRLHSEQTREEFHKFVVRRKERKSWWCHKSGTKCIAFYNKSLFSAAFPGRTNRYHHQMPEHHFTLKPWNCLIARQRLWSRSVAGRVASCLWRPCLDGEVAVGLVTLHPLAPAFHIPSLIAGYSQMWYGMRRVFLKENAPVLLGSSSTWLCSACDFCHGQQDVSLTGTDRRHNGCDSLMWSLTPSLAFYDLRGVTLSFRNSFLSSVNGSFLIFNRCAKNFLGTLESYQETK